MEKVIKLEDAKVYLSREAVLEQIECYEESPIYEEVIAEYEEIRAEMLALCKPIILFKFGMVDDEITGEYLQAGNQVVYALFSIGEGIAAYSTAAFEKGDYLKGMLSDAIADNLLFSLEREAAELLRVECAKRHVGITKRLEAPGHMPMIAQKIIHRETEAEQICGIKISDGYMFAPIKSNGIVFILTENENVFRSQHDCRACDRLDCKMRNIPNVEIFVNENGKEYKIEVKEKQSILEALIQAGGYLSAVCGGKGTCGKCKIRVSEGQLPITDSDQKVFTKEELASGYRLACKAFPTDWVAIETCFGNEDDFEILSTHDGEERSEKTADESFVIAIDIGTTTIALQLLGVNSGAVIDTYTTINKQRAYGADVISRIKASGEGKKAELQESIKADLDHGITQLLQNTKTTKEQLKEIAIAGNTTMGHLLMGYDCESLGLYPFTPVNISLIEDEYEHIPVSILPGISTFVGGDIAAGLLACEFDCKDEIAMLIDLGTNGEMAIGNKKRIMVTSTAAGPAFEGGNIKWGMGSVAGAINSVTITENAVAQVATIADKAPIGICGTGVIEAVAELVRAELVEAAGLLDDDYFEDGFSLAKTSTGEEIVITQKDIREIQLAKASVRAGVETLALRYGVSLDDIDHVYLAGGFGFKLDVEKAIQIGMLPSEFEGKIKTVGNSSLGGAAEFLKGEEEKTRIEKIIKISEEINLSADKEFNEFYMDAMFFEKDE